MLRSPTATAPAAHVSRTHRRSRARILAVLFPFALAACEGATDPGAAASIRIASPAVAGVSTAAESGRSIQGSNGTLLITDITLGSGEVTVAVNRIAAGT